MINFKPMLERIEATVDNIVDVVVTNIVDVIVTNTVTTKITNDAEDDVVNVTNGGLDINIQDQTTRALDLFFLRADAPPEPLAVDTIIDNNILSLVDAGAFSIGDYVGVFSGTTGENAFFFAEVVGIAGNDLIIDTPIDHVFNAGDNVLPTNRNLNVDGSVTPQIFSIQGPASEENAFEIDITRIIFKIICGDPPEFSMFGDIPGGLDLGIVLRRSNGTIDTYFNAKTNGELANLMYDIAFYDQTKNQGVNGIVGRMTFAGQSKHGVTIRLGAGEKLELIVQDDLSSLESFRIIAQGHVVE